MAASPAEETPALLWDAVELRRKWAWMVVIGSVLVVAGFVALGSIIAATLAGLFIIAVAMIAGGLAEIVHGFAMRSWGKFFFWILIGSLYVIAGFCVFANPLFAAAWFTLFLGVALVALGVLRCIFAFHLPADAPTVLVLISGALSVGIGVYILALWPASSLWVIGAFLGVDLVFAGVGWISIGLALRHPESATSPEGASSPA
jgi:aquaporin Z